MKIFISYSSIDKKEAKKIATLLGKMKIDYFLDKKDISWGDNIKEKIEDSILECTHLIVLISPASLKSQWVPYELGSANRLGIHILPYKVHPSIDLPDFLKSFLNKSTVDEIKEYLIEQKKNPPFLRKKLDLNLLTPKCGFITLEPFSRRMFTTNMDAHGYKELLMSVDIGGKLPNFTSRFIIRPARYSRFENNIYQNFEDISLRVGSREDFGIVRKANPIPIGANELVINCDLIPNQSWLLNETKQFFATTGPISNPTGYHSAPLTIKRIK